MKNSNKSFSAGKKPLSLQMQQRLREGIFLLCVALSIFLLVSLATFSVNDPGWSSTGIGKPVTNWCGHLGSLIADIFLSLFGAVAFVYPFLMILVSWLALKNEEVDEVTPKERLFKALGFLLFIVSSCVLVHFYVMAHSHFPVSAGGMIGDVIGQGTSALLNRTGSTLLFLTGFLCSITLLTGLSWLALAELIGQSLVSFIYYLKEKRTASRAAFLEMSSDVRGLPKIIAQDSVPDTFLIEQPVPIPSPKPPMMMRPDKRKIEIDPSIKMSPGTLPSLDLLNSPAKGADRPFNNITFEALSELVEQRLSDFGVEVKVTSVLPGPVITRFELELAPGIKVSKISGLAKDIARSLSTVSVRIVEVIPGKSVIGLEIPNENRELVTLRDILNTEKFTQNRSPVSLVLGKDISGQPVIVDLAKMPHLLVAGTTGSGKSVSLNAMLLSMLFKSTPQQLRMIMIDPKMLELSVYDGIPHLLTSVITDMKDAANALRWCVAEMDKRYRLMAALGVRNITGYNQKVNEAIKQGQPLSMPGILVTDEASARAFLEPLPMIVVVADELADMMMVVGKKIEDLIARIAQKARAAGIHLILATQRPSVDVITGLIKANIPTRIAFQVSSRIDSRTILDQQGAEQLLGHGDMLYLPPGAGVPIRVHGAYVADEEVHRVVAAWRSAETPTYLESITDEATDSSQEMLNSGEQDPLYDEAVKIVTEGRRASISLVQRRLRIGYNRAARMMEEMEIAGVVSSMDNNGTREVLAPAPVE